VKRRNDIQINEQRRQDKVRKDIQVNEQRRQDKVRKDISIQVIGSILQVSTNIPKCEE